MPSPQEGEAMGYSHYLYRDRTLDPEAFRAGCRCDLCREAHRRVEVTARERRRTRTEQETAAEQ